MDIAQFLYILAVVLIAAKILGELSQMVGQPAVLGELVAGVVIGPYVLNLIQDPELFQHKHMFYLLAEIGVLLLLFEIGLETRLKDLLKVGGKSLAVGLTGIILPFLLAWIFCSIVGKTTMESIMVGAALTATSIGITSKVFAELGFLGTKESQIVLGAAVIDDILALAILSIITALGTADQKMDVWFVLYIITVSISFLLLAILVGKHLVNPLTKLLEKMRSRGIMTIGAVCFALFLSLLAVKAESSIIIGAFVAGILLAETPQKGIIEEGLRPLVDFFTPIFFVSVGIAMNLSVFNIFNPSNHKLLLWVVILVIIAVISKFTAGFVIRTDKDTSRSIIGSGMIPRGEVGLIFAAMGMITGILTDELYTIIVTTVIISTMMAPPLLKWLISKKEAARIAEG
jgi:Kef-type K+ transport system membrane component KefB